MASRLEKRLSSMYTIAVEPQTRRLVPAWALSAGLHALVFALLPLILEAPDPAGLEPVDRPVSIVLTRAEPDSTAAASARAESSEPSSSAAPAPWPSTEAAERVEEPTPAALAAALPTLDAQIAALSATPQLPQLDDLAVPAGPALETNSPLQVAGRARVPIGLDPSGILAAEAARRAAEGARGPVTQVQLFGGAPSQGRSFVFVIDRSKSMGGQGLGALAAAESELLRAVRPLTNRHQFQVIAYHHQCVFLQQKRALLACTDENKAAITGFLSGLAAFGATDHRLGLMAALQLEPDVIYLLTDGGDPALNAGEIAQLAKLAGGRTSIHCIHFGRGPLQDEEHFLRRLASSLEGEYGYVDMGQSR